MLPDYRREICVTGEAQSVRSFGGDITRPGFDNRIDDGIVVQRDPLSRICPDHLFECVEHGLYRHTDAGQCNRARVAQ